MGKSKFIIFVIYIVFIITAKNYLMTYLTEANNLLLEQLNL